MNKRCASSITGNWEDDHSILKTDNKEHLLGWRVYCPRARYPSATRDGWIISPPLSTQEKHLLRVGHYWLHCKGPATCLCPAVHVSLTVLTRVGGDISPDQARVWRCSSKSRVFWQQPVRLWWNPPAQWVQRIKWVWFPFYERNELLEAWKCFWYWLPQSLVTFGVTKCHNPTVSWNEEIFKIHIAW